MKIIRFLGSLRFAIILLTLAAITVITGTLLESATQSHEFAAAFTYRSPLFAAILSGIFINILVSALLRWPFRWRHIPFLITHLGLLMIISGTLIKLHWGLQGYMILKEGNSSDWVLIPGSKSLYVEKSNPSLPPLKVTELNSHPHGEVRYASWIKEGRLDISGLNGQEWSLESFQTEIPSTSAREFYSKKGHLRLLEVNNDRLIAEKSIEDAVKSPLAWNDGELQVTLQMEGEGTPQLLCTHLDYHTGRQESCSIPLSGPDALLHRFPVPIALEIEVTPTLLWLQDDAGAVTLYAFDAHGRIFSTFYPADKLETLVVYGRGFGGYAQQATIPFPAKGESRRNRELARLHEVIDTLRRESSADGELAAPLALLKQGCQDKGIDFPETTAAFLDTWDRSRKWLLRDGTPLNDSVREAIDAIDTSSLSDHERRAAQWNVQIISRFETRMDTGETLESILKNEHWPLYDHDSLGEEELKTLITRQIFSAAEALPDTSNDPIDKAALLSGLLRAHGIMLDQLPLAASAPTSLTLESPLQIHHRPLTPLAKREENRPLTTFQAGNETIDLLFDPNGSGLKHPLHAGAYLARYQPGIETIPYIVRLRHARRIDYPGTSQPYSYEADLVVTDKASGKQVETTISMNRVYETADGYRFYLSNLTPNDAGAVKQVQLVVNRDPAKYWLTYPGAFLLVLGVFLLFGRFYRLTQH